MTADVTVGNKLNTAQIDVGAQPFDDPVAKLNLRVRDRVGIVEFLEIDSDGRMYVLTENIPSNCDGPLQPLSFVSRQRAFRTACSTFLWTRRLLCPPGLSRFSGWRRLFPSNRKGRRRS